MAAQTGLRNTMATAWAAAGNTYSLHTGAPGASGTDNEATGGGYARKTTTFGSASGGTVTGSEMVFDVVGDDYTHMCRWDGGTLLNVFDTPDVTVTPSGQVKVTPSYTYPNNVD